MGPCFSLATFRVQAYRHYFSVMGLHAVALAVHLDFLHEEARLAATTSQGHPAFHWNPFRSRIGNGPVYVEICAAREIVGKRVCAYWN
jgi:hypothetical protein